MSLTGCPVNHPKHYLARGIKCGCSKEIECIDVTRHFNFNLGNAIKYIWRADYKGKCIEDLKKAIWYLEDEIKMRSENSYKRQNSLYGLCGVAVKNTNSFTCAICYLKFETQEEAEIHALNCELC